jgi:hypothetical protein
VHDAGDLTPPALSTHSWICGVVARLPSMSATVTTLPAPHDAFEPVATC